MNLTWISRKGKKRQENRDYCGIAISKDEILFIVADGSTQGPKGKLLVEELCQYVVDEFLTINERHDELVLDILKNAHNKLRIKYPADSASFIILTSSENYNKIKVYHLGDCRLGTFENEICWRTNAHLLEIEKIKTEMSLIKHHRRSYSLTKSFRAREFFKPDLTILNKNYFCVLLSTDGFWCDLNFKFQQELLEDCTNFDSISNDDDVSCLLVKDISKLQLSKLSDNTKNIYMKSVCD